MIRVFCIVLCLFLVFGVGCGGGGGSEDDDVGGSFIFGKFKMKFVFFI